MNTQFFKNRSNEIAESLHNTRGNSSAGKPSRRAGNAKAAAQAEKIERYARTGHHVLLTGERGTGKTTIARQIHEKSSRRHKQFVSFNCATLKEELVEAELFGYEKGAFTGANPVKAGLFETGSGGTVFLDEVGEMSLSLQAKLLKAVEEKRIRRVGASAEISVDLRIIAATSRNLRAMTERENFVTICLTASTSCRSPRIRCASKKKKFVNWFLPDSNASASRLGSKKISNRAFRVCAARRLRLDGKFPRAA